MKYRPRSRSKAERAAITTFILQDGASINTGAKILGVHPSRARTIAIDTIELALGLNWRELYKKFGTKNISELRKRKSEIIPALIKYGKSEE